MTITYLHDIDESHNDKDKIVNILSKFGDNVIVPDIKYRNKNNINSYTNMIAEISDNNIIVGKMLGGYLSYFISDILKMPCLILDPLLFTKSGAELRPVHLSDRSFPNKHIIMSLKNEEIDVKKTLRYMKEKGYSEVKVYDNLKKIDLYTDEFEQEFSIFRNYYFNIFKNNNDNNNSEKISEKSKNKSDSLPWWYQ